MSPTKRIIPVRSVHKDEDIQCDGLVLRIAVVLRRRDGGIGAPGIFAHARGFHPWYVNSHKGAIKTRQ
jgi:hypothetical protein